VGSIVGRSPAACRQLASRARRRIESETSPARFDVDKGELSVVEQFIQASAEGDMDALVQVLDRRRRGGPTRRRRPGAPREAVVGRDRVVGLLLWFLRNWT
jgi:RNA polymerase sigma-70 factor (ECF subfamily)